MQLALDTSTSFALIALRNGDEIIECRFQPKATQKLIFSELASILNPENMSLLDAIIVGTGPGSFTGVKIGVTAAKALAWSRGIPLYSSDSLDLVASGLSAEINKGYENLVVAVSSTKGEVFIKFYAYDGITWTSNGKILDILLDETSLEDYLPKSKIMVSGEASEILGDASKNIREMYVVPSEYRTPSAAGMFGVLDKKKLVNETEDPVLLIPQYVRLSQAERNLLRGAE